jgi:hypothetical protein
MEAEDTVAEPVWEAKALEAVRAASEEEVELAVGEELAAAAAVAGRVVELVPRAAVTTRRA